MQWYIFNDCFRAFIITRNSQELPIWKSSPQDLQDLEEWSKEYLDYDTDKDKWPNQLASRLTRLAEILHIKDVLDLVPATCQALILIPHRYLHLLPLHALPKKGRGQRAEGRRKEKFLVCPMLMGLKPLTLVMKKEGNMYFETRSARNTASLLKPLTLVMGFPSALCLLPSALPPLAALPLSGNGENYLLDRFPDGVKYAPSCQLLKFTKKHDNHSLGGLFAISDPNENLTYTNIEVATIARHFQPVTVLKKSFFPKKLHNTPIISPIYSIW